MARVSANEIDREVERWLGEICLTLELDRAAIIYLGRGVTHRWNRPGIAAIRYGTVTMKISPWISMRVLEGREMVWSKGMHLPREAADYERFMKEMGQTAQVALPFRVGGVTVGGVTFGKFRTGYRWQPRIVRQLRLVAEFLGHLLQRRDIEMQLEKVRSELTLASRRMMMGELVASISHEVNQPLGAILTNAQTARRMLSADVPAIPDVIPALTDIVDDARRASEIVRRVRAMFKGDETSKATLQVDSLLAECEALLRNEAAIRRIELKVAADSSLAPILGDRIQLLQCVTNLALNGFDSIADEHQGRREVTITAAKAEPGYINISVRDSGVGIDTAISDRIFDAFVTTKPQGMGIGLLVVRSIVEGHGGRIWAQSDPGGGAIFTCALPVVRTNNGAGSAWSDERPSQSSGHRRRRLDAPSA
ncbi:MAG TPA: HAMP domain-containing sensor histidine kinase [Candidatus Binataceae bacterium]|nr:HAMP domain-containing sensor histidine kinase [Candidatus Binataceae bacterium]